MKTTNYPATVRELAEMAQKLGMLPSELLEMLGPLPMPPAGYTLAPKSEARWIGPEIVSRRWIITPAWNATTNTHSLDVWIADHTPPTYADMSADEALQLAADLRAVAETIRQQG